MTFYYKKEMAEKKEMDNEIEIDYADNSKGRFVKIRQDFNSPLRAVLGSKKGKAVCFRSSTLDEWPEDVMYTHTLDMSALSASDKRSLRLDHIPGVRIRRSVQCNLLDDT